MQKYQKLLSPLPLKHTELKNRVVMGSMHTGLEEKDYQRLAAYFSARAKGGVGLIITGGYSPNLSGKVYWGAASLQSRWQLKQHKYITNAVHQQNGKIALQILHAGRYAYSPLAVGPSAIKAPITPFKPRKMSNFGIKRTIKQFAKCAWLAERAGYDGVEIMGSEGYLINQFICQRTNKRTDYWGGDYQQRIRFPLEIVKAIRSRVSTAFVVIFRLSMLDLIQDGSSPEEIISLAKQLEQAGVDILNTGIGWHEARIPTIATMVPRGAFRWVPRQIKQAITLPIIATNRINTPDIAEDILVQGDADLVSMARPLLADPEFVNKAQLGRPDTINTCIACNQACLDHTFSGKVASCLVNPLACHETELTLSPAIHKKRVAVVGAGPAGLSCAITAAMRGHDVSLFESSAEIGGQFNLAKQIPGKQEFNETLRYYQTQCLEQGVKVFLNTAFKEEYSHSFDEIIIATGVYPTIPDIAGIDHPSVVTYTEVLQQRCIVGQRVAIVGAGGIGFDIAEYLIASVENQENFYKTWGIDTDYQQRGGLVKPELKSSVRSITLMQRKTGKIGRNLGKTTGWIHRTSLKQQGVKFVAGVVYHKIDDEGLHYSLNGSTVILAVDNVVICAGQNENQWLYQQLKTTKNSVHIIGGAKLAAELDAKRAIKQGFLIAKEL